MFNLDPINAKKLVSEIQRERLNHAAQEQLLAQIEREKRPGGPRSILSMWSRNWAVMTKSRMASSAARAQL